MKSLKSKIEKIFRESTIAETSSTGTTGEHIIYAPFNEMVDDIVSIIEYPKTFEEAVEPLIKWMSENQHPHTTVIVTGTRAELVEGLQCHLTDEFIVD
jgi:hypothetical protein